MSRIIHQIALCHDCGKEWQNYTGSRAQKAAYAHAKRTNHKVSVETTIACNYN